MKMVATTRTRTRTRTAILKTAMATKTKMVAAVAVTIATMKMAAAAAVTARRRRRALSRATGGAWRPCTAKGSPRSTHRTSPQTLQTSPPPSSSFPLLSSPLSFSWLNLLSWRVPRRRHSRRLLHRRVLFFQRWHRSRRLLARCRHCCLHHGFEGLAVVGVGGSRLFLLLLSSVRKHSPPPHARTPPHTAPRQPFAKVQP
mmetsp:Transcript_5373/g.10199  ORF Transcript_5373/g.10199 Transcript_5373/m.10199 type:complete len:200 (+) Transcript_5373:366-965(+)